MTSELVVRVLDHTTAIRAPKPIVSMLEEVLRPLVVATPGPADGIIDVAVGTDGRWCVGVGDTSIDGRVVQPGRGLALILERLNRDAAASVRSGVPFHAAAVTFGDHAMLLAGSSGAGKSTLCAGAVMSGWGFVAEEVAVVDEGTLTVRPYPRPIGLRSGGADALSIDYPSDDCFTEVFPWLPPSSVNRPASPVIGIVVVARSDRPEAPESMSPAAALTALVEHTVVPSDDQVAPIFRRLESIVRRLPVAKLSYDLPATGVDELSNLARDWSRTAQGSDGATP